jgi:hypothetical protein
MLCTTSEWAFFAHPYSQSSGFPQIFLGFGTSRIMGNRFLQVKTVPEDLHSMIHDYYANDLERWSVIARIQKQRFLDGRQALSPPE